MSPPPSSLLSRHDAEADHGTFIANSSSLAAIFAELLARRDRV